MALRGALQHRKTRKLARLLGIPPCFALGIMEAVWHVTASQHALRTGAIGRLGDDEIADQLGYTGDEHALVRAMVDAGFLDEHPLHRLVVHDWHVHSDNTLDAQMYRAGERYANGTIPRGVKLGAAEKASLFAQHYQQLPHDMFTVSAMPAAVPAKPAAPEQVQEPMRATGTLGVMPRPAPAEVVQMPTRASAITPVGKAVEISPSPVEALQAATEVITAPYGAVRRLPEPEPVPEPEPEEHPPTPHGGVGLCGEVEHKAWTALKTALKLSLRDVPDGLTRPGRKLQPIRAGGDDYDDCFRDAWFISRARRPDGWVVALASADPPMTQEGVTRYARRLEELAVRAFGMSRGAKVRFVVRDG